LLQQQPRRDFGFNRGDCVAKIVLVTIAKRFCLVAIGEVDGNVVVVMADPLNVVALDTVTLKIKRQIKPAISSPREIKKAIELKFLFDERFQR